MILDALIECPFCQSENIDIIDEATGFAECLTCLAAFDTDGDE